MCSHMSPMVIDTVASLRVAMPDGHLLGLQTAYILAPEGPFFELDKPPLI